MKIDEKIQAMQIEIIKILTESEGSRENLTQILEKMGLDRETTEKLIQTFIKAENAKNAVKNIWYSDTRIDYSTDVAEYQQQELETRQNFDSILNNSSLLIVANTIDPNDINDEILQKLYEQGIVESQIINPALRITFHYYVENKINEIVKSEEKEKMKQLTSKIGSHATALKSKIVDLETEVNLLQSENAVLKDENEKLRIAYKYVEDKYKTRIVSNEKNFQAALEQIKALKKEIRNLQDRGVFKIIGDKLFRGRRKQLLAPTVEIPSTLYESAAEKMAVTRGEGEKLGLSIGKKVANNVKTNDAEEVEK